MKTRYWVFLILIFSIYFLSNFIFGFIFISDGYVEFEGKVYYEEIQYIEFLLYLLSFILFFIGGLVFINLKTNEEIKLSEREWSLLYVLMLFSCLLSIYYTLNYSLNIAGKANSSEISFFIKLSSLIFSPNYLIPFFLCLKFYSFNKYLALSMLFVISLILQGWMGGIMLLVFSWLINYGRYWYNWPKNTLLFSSVFIIILFIALPSLQFMKHYFREPNGTFFQGLIDFFSISLYELYSSIFKTIFLRFQSIDLYTLVLKNKQQLISLYYENNIVPSYFDNIPAYYLGLWGDAKPYGQVFASYIIGENVQWATHPLAIGWYLIEGISFLFFSLVIIPLSFLLAGYVGGKQFKYLIFMYLISFYWHGWMSAYLNLIFFLILFIVYLKITRYLTRMRY